MFGELWFFCGRRGWGGCGFVLMLGAWIYSWLCWRMGIHFGELRMRYECMSRVGRSVFNHVCEFVYCHVNVVVFNHVIWKKLLRPPYSKLHLMF